MNTDLCNLKTAVDKAVHDANNWHNVCEEVAKIFGGNNALLIPSNPNFRGLWLACTPSLAPALEEYIADRWHLNDFRHKTIPLVAERGYATDDDILSGREQMFDMPYYTDFLWKHDIGFFIGMRLPTPNGLWVICVYFNHERSPITEEEIALADQVSQLIADAVISADTKAHNSIAAFARFFSGTKSEIYIFDPQGDECLSIDQDGKFSSDAGRPDFLNTNLTTELRDEIGEICASAPELSLSNSYIVKRDDKRVNLLVVQVPPFLRHFHIPFKVCVIACECNDQTIERHQTLRIEFNLTKSEILTLELLAAGNNTSSIAELLSVKTSSIRQRLKGMYEKTDTNGQVVLVSFYNGL